MLKLRRDLSRAVTILEMIKRREKSKRELLHLTLEIVEKRYERVLVRTFWSRYVMTWTVNLNMKSEWNELSLEGAVILSLNWTLCLKIHLIWSGISISSC